MKAWHWLIGAALVLFGATSGIALAGGPKDAWVGTWVLGLACFIFGFLKKNYPKVA